MAFDWLSGLGNPFVDLQLSILSSGRAPDELCDAVHDAAPVADAFSRQRVDGSRGAADDRRRRVLPTLWMVKALGDLGVGARHIGWRKAVDFLSSVTHTRTGVFSLSGGPDRVLSCYVGIAAVTYLRAGLRDLAEPQIAWIAAHQDVRRKGVQCRPGTVEPFSRHLQTRYGGCMADTTCLIGLVKAGQALELWVRGAADTPDVVEARGVLEAIREAFLSRRLLYRGDGSVMGLGTPAGDPAQWLLPTFPLDWRTDLIEVLDPVARCGAPDLRMQPALDRMAGLRLPDGTWPLRRAFWPADLPALARRGGRRGNPLVSCRGRAGRCDLNGPDRAAPIP